MWPALKKNNNIKMVQLQGRGLARNEDGSTVKELCSTRGRSQLSTRPTALKCRAGSLIRPRSLAHAATRGLQRTLRRSLEISRRPVTAGLGLKWRRLTRRTTAVRIHSQLQKVQPGVSPEWITPNILRYVSVCS